MRLEIVRYGPRFVCTGIAVEKEDSLGGGDWTLAADLAPALTALGKTVSVYII